MFMVRSPGRSVDGGRHCMLSVAMVFASLLSFLFVVELIQAEAANEGSIKGLAFPKRNYTSFTRKLLQSPDYSDGNRNGNACSKDDIEIYQGSTAPLPDGIPSFSVQILNVCGTDCSISDIHVRCGWFSSVRLINPAVFRRLYFDDCLVNNGEPLGPGEILSFDYANSFRYPLSVSSVACS